MINQDDIEAFTDNHTAADDFCRRADKGLPPDRWATTNDMHKVAKAYETLWYLWISEMEKNAQLQKQAYEAGLRSIRMEGEP